MDEDPDRSVDEILDWLCWARAMDGERFYPPEETADECMEAVEDLYEDRPEEEYWEAVGLERGQHSRALCDARDFFQQMEKRGFDPKARAKREVERSREQGLELEDIDWTWLEGEE